MEPQVPQFSPPLSPAPRRHTSIAAKLLAAVVVAALLAAGTLGFGRIGDDATVAMGLTSVWFGVVLAGGFLVSLRRPSLRWWMAAGYAVVAIVAGAVLVLPTLRDREVNEDVATAAPAPAAPRGGAEREGSRAKPAGNVELFTGSFRSIAHSGKGTANVIELAEGGRVVTLTGFETDSGPDLRLYVSTGDPAGGDLGDFKDLGTLKGNKGNQQYELPNGLDLERYSTVVVWCRAFSVPFTSARLEKA